VIVVDTNLLVYLYVSGANTGQAERVLVRPAGMRLNDRTLARLKAAGRA